MGKILQKETGQGFAELMDSGQSLGDVLQVLYDSVGGDATKFAALWSSVEAGTGALSLANSGAEKFNDVLGQMVDSSGATETAYTTMTDTMAHRMESLKTNAANLGIALFDSVSGKLGAAVSLASGYLQTLTDGFTSGGFAGLAEGLGSIFTDLTTNVGPQLLPKRHRPDDPAGARNGYGHPAIAGTGAAHCGRPGQRAARQCGAAG